jgi:hypothetical protein
MHARWSLPSVLSLAVAVARADPAPFTIDEAAGCLGLSPKQMAEARGGKIVSGDFPELTDKELAIAVAMVVDGPIAEVAEAVRSSSMFELNPNVLSFGDLGDGDPSAAGFEAVEFTADERSEIRGLLDAEPGSEFNLSMPEIRRFESLRERLPPNCERDPECATVVVEEYRGVLLERLRAYHEGGTNAVAPYAREGGETADPAQELRTAAQACVLLEQRFPELQRALVEYPRYAVEGVESRFHWVKQRVRGRPAFVLQHRMLFARPDALLGVERDFYVGHSFNSLLVMGGALPLENRTMVFYVNRTSTDQVAGFAKATRHSLGRKHLREQVIEDLERIRAEFESGAE